MAEVGHLTMGELQAGLAAVREAPLDGGVLEMIVRRPEVEAREVLGECELDPARGLVGDCWKARGSSDTSDGSAHPDMQLTLMNSRAAQLVARDRERWCLAGDQLFVDLDLSTANLPPGMQLAIGGAVIEISPELHTGCKKFAARFGTDALRFVNSAVGRQLNLRGVNARIVLGGTVRVGDVARKRTG